MQDCPLVYADWMPNVFQKQIITIDWRAALGLSLEKNLQICII
jgi:hypothetical protein